MWNMAGAGLQFQYALGPGHRACRTAMGFSGQPDMYLLAMRFPSVQPIWERERQWPAIGLEGGVAPIALVLHLKDLALE